MNNISELNKELYKEFWRRLQQLKFESIYLSIYFKNCDIVDRIIKIITWGGTSLVTAIWMGWYQIRWVSIVCPILIYFFQAVVAISNFLPFEIRKKEINKMLSEINLLFDNMEADWRKINGLKYSNDEIEDKINTYSRAVTEISNKYFTKVSLPENEKIQLEAEDKTEKYFNCMYKGERIE